ncbi:MAG: 4-hydroxy-tetrahydrodipicolinate reductase [Anaerohalosphaeraceae bacterium]|nr:4-hydroxy-tetrahydrodipicolinate reductase [Anaerohalosphaeraceae bacterium]
MASKLIINGAAGRMGKRILALANESKAFDIIAATDAASCPDIGKDAGTLAGIEPLGIEITSEMPAGADAVIDFSLPQATGAIIDYCLENGCALVMGTTGLSSEQLERIEKAAKKIALIQAANMSVGMNLLFELVGMVAKKLGPEYDIEITETHHRFKKDSPSGSAMTLAQRIAEAAGKDFPGSLDIGRKGKEALRIKGSIGMNAIRMGNVVGEHSIMFGSLGETVTLSHNAFSRDTFASGAVRAAQWLSEKAPGNYSMADVLER